MAFEENTYNHLEELGGSDFEMVGGEPDIIGWDVKTEEGQKIGEIDDLLFNPQSRKVRYLVVDSNKLHLDKGRKVLIPIGIADLYSKKERIRDDERAYDDNRNSHSEEYVVQRKGHNAYDPAYDGNVVILPGVTIAQLNALPLYEKNHLSPQTETAIRKIFGGKGASSNSPDYNQDEFYNHEHFNDDRFYNRANARKTSRDRGQDASDEKTHERRAGNRVDDDLDRD
jgi:hypothetical protein